MSNIKTQVRAYINENFLLDAEAAAFLDADSLLDKHILDSTGFLELVMFIEETFGIQVAEDELVPENLDSLDAVEAYVTRKLSA
ncbi:MAG: hypothetical protein RI907_3989 [Pseudomonadota bacterium]|jgi:acyl carrier protein